MCSKLTSDPPKVPEDRYVATGGKVLRIPLGVVPEVGHIDVGNRIYHISSTDLNEKHPLLICVIVYTFYMIRL